MKISWLLMPALSLGLTLADALWCPRMIWATPMMIATMCATR